MRQKYFTNTFTNDDKARKQTHELASIQSKITLKHIVKTRSGIKAKQKCQYIANHTLQNLINFNKHSNKHIRFTPFSVSVSFAFIQQQFTLSQYTCYCHSLFHFRLRLRLLWEYNILHHSKDTCSSLCCRLNSIYNK